MHLWFTPKFQYGNGRLKVTTPRENWKAFNFRKRTPLWRALDQPATGDGAHWGALSTAHWSVGDRQLSIGAPKSGILIAS